jgi:hypothetical protein
MYRLLTRELTYKRDLQVSWQNFQDVLANFAKTGLSRIILGSFVFLDLL